MTDRVRRTRGEAKPDENVAETTLTVMSSLSVGKKKGKESTDVKKLRVHPFAVEPAYVRVSAGMTVNMGNFESLRVDVAISMPCYKEEIDEAVPIVADMVSAHLTEELYQYQNAKD